MDLDAVYAQSDYNAKHRWLGREHNLSAGVDAARESFQNFALAPPAGTTIVKPPTTVGAPADGAWVDESLRVADHEPQLRSQGAWCVRARPASDRADVEAAGRPALGQVQRQLPRHHRARPAHHRHAARCQPLLRAGRHPLQRAAIHCSATAPGVLFQPTPNNSLTTSLTAPRSTPRATPISLTRALRSTDPESSRNVELGAKLDLRRRALDDARGRCFIRPSSTSATATPNRSTPATTCSRANATRQALSLIWQGASHPRGRSSVRMPTSRWRRLTARAARRAPRWWALARA